MRNRRILATVGLIAVAAVSILSGASSAGAGMVSMTGVVGAPGRDVGSSRLALDPTRGRALVVWRSDADGVGSSSIIGRFVDSSTGDAVGPPFPIAASLGVAGSSVRDPAVVFDASNDEFIVGFARDDLVETGPAVADEFEVWVQRIGGDGRRNGAPSKVSRHAAGRSGQVDSMEPALAVEPRSGSVLVAWQSDDPIHGLVDDEFEIIDVLLERDGSGDLVPTAAPARLSVTGADGDAATAARRPTVAFDPQATRWLVAWEATEGAGGLPVMIEGRVLDANGRPIATQFVVSTGTEAHEPTVAADPRAGGFAVAWTETTGYGPAVVAALVSSNGTVTAGPTTIGTGSDAGASSPSLTFDLRTRRYAIVWIAETVAPPMREIRMQELDGSGSLIGDARTVASPGATAMGGNVSLASPDVVIGPAGRIVVSWVAADPPTTADDQNEVFALATDAATLRLLPATGSDTSGLVTVGVVVVAIGAALTILSVVMVRRRRTSQS